MRGDFEFRQKPLEDPLQILGDVVVPDADHALAECAQPAVTLPVFAFRVLAAVELDDQAPLVMIDRLLADKFEAAELPSAYALP